MFAVLKFRHAIAKSSKNVFILQARGYLQKTNSFTRLLERFRIPEPHIKNIQNSKLTPKGYEVIYISPIYYHLNFGHLLLWILWPSAFSYFYVNFQDPEYYENKFKWMHSSKAGAGLLLLALPIVLHWFLLRNVRIIFKKKDQYKTLIYGILGPFRKIYIDHGKYAYKKRPSSYFFHILKSRKIIVFKENFGNELDYYGLIIVENEERSYL